MIGFLFGLGLGTYITIGLINTALHILLNTSVFSVRYVGRRCL
jgi:high-affinity nickel permease